MAVTSQAFTYIQFYKIIISKDPDILKYSNAKKRFVRKREKIVVRKMYEYRFKFVN